MDYVHVRFVPGDLVVTSEKRKTLGTGIYREPTYEDPRGAVAAMFEDDVGIVLASGHRWN
jgi:hypothetical protein